MEEYYHAGLSKAKGVEQTDRQSSKALRAVSDGHTQGTVGCHGVIPDRDRQIPAASQRPDCKAPHLGEHHGGIESGPWDHDYQDKGRFGKDNFPHRHRGADTDEGFAEGTIITDDGAGGGNRKEASNEGSVTAENKAQVGGTGSLSLHDALYLAKTIEDILNLYELEEKKKKYVPKQDRKKRKKTKHQSQDDCDLSL